ncbi:MAG: xanthine dehydrogenase family protein subunit M [Burkholderiales bacterium]|nr:xanthine dehydrogenase family protein subunit M [Burkholderiales bacterium]
MKPPRFDYAAPETVDDALRLLAEHGEAARLLAGGQSLIPALRFRLSAPDLLIDLERIEVLAAAEPRRLPDGAFAFGAMTRHRAFERSPLVRERLPLLCHAMHFVAHAQIRNRGTIGGSLCHADPAAEWPALCLACDADMVARSSGGTRRIRAQDFVCGPFMTALNPEEILLEVVFPAWPARRGWGFREVSRRRGDFALAGVACIVDLDQDGRCENIRIAIFGAGETSMLATAAADALRGRVPSKQNIREAARAARAGIVPSSDHHASPEYRSDLVEALTTRALCQAVSLPEPS